MRKPFLITCLAVLITVLAGCKEDKLDVDISKVEVPEVKFQRMEKELFALQPSNIAAETQNFQHRYGNFYNRFVNFIVNNGGVADSSYAMNLARFISDHDMRGAYNETGQKFSDQDIATLGHELTDVCKRYKVHFPNKPLPKRFVTYMSGFNYNVVYVDSTIGVGLDMYLGSADRYYQMLKWPSYRTALMNQRNVLPDVVRGWIIADFDNTDAINNLLGHMIFHGKVLYAMDAMLPDVADSLKIGYTSEQMKYCDSYEKNLWGYFADKNRLYENNLKTIAEYTNDGPFTGAISKECPPRIAMWVGWQIVRSYMKKNPDVSLQQLMAEMDVQKVLTKSKYKP